MVEVMKEKAVCCVGRFDEILTILLTPPVPSKGRWCSARPYPTGLRFCALRTALMRLGVAAVFICTVRLASHLFLSSLLKLKPECFLMN